VARDINCISRGLQHRANHNVLNLFGLDAGLRQRGLGAAGAQFRRINIFKSSAERAKRSSFAERNTRSLSDFSVPCEPS
jgi:hypothetical protein